MKIIPREARRITYSTEIRNLKKRLKLSDYQKSVVIGTILGDGNLVNNWSKTNYSLQIAHSVKQSDYLLWKYNILKEWILSKPRFYERNRSITIKTISHSEITELAELFYKNGVKIIPHNLNRLIANPITLAVWFMDDGNIIRRNGKVYGYHLNTQSFTKDENELIARTILEVYGVKTLLELNHNKYRLRIMKKDDRVRFQNIIDRYILQEMRYKIS